MKKRGNADYFNNAKCVKLVVFLVLNVILVGFDQFTKHLAYVRLYGKSPYVLIKGVLELSYLQNAGAAWGMLQGRQTLFIALTVLILAAIIYVLLKTPLTRRYAPLYVIMTLLSAGAVGNFIDRALNGYVHDFIYFVLIDFPVFNVADCYVTISMVLFVVCFLFMYGDEEFAYLKPGKKVG
jgi:signal peptidase II